MYIYIYTYPHSCATTILIPKIRIHDVFIPHLILWGSLFLVLYPAVRLRLRVRLFVTQLVTHNNLSHTSLSHTILHTQSYTHTHTKLCHTQLCHTHTQSFTHNFVTQSFTHNFVTHYFSHTILHTQLCHITTLSHTIFLTHTHTLDQNCHSEF